MFSKLQVKEEPKELVLILRNDGISTVKYDCHDNVEVYTFCRYDFFLEYIEDLIKRRWKKTTIINKFDSFRPLILLLKRLHLVHVEMTSKQDSTETQNDPKSKVTNCAWSLGLQFINILPHSLLEPDLLAPGSVMIQQYLRFIDLKHGANLVSTKDMDSVLEEPTNLVSQIVNVQPIIDTSQPLSLIIPSSWDSFNKIILLAKSSIYEDDRLLGSELDCNQLNLLYDSGFDGTDAEMETLLARFEPLLHPQVVTRNTKELLTLNQMLKQAHQIAQDNHNKEVLH
jgi:hypothetical protein